MKQSSDGDEAVSRCELAEGSGDGRELWLEDAASFFSRRRGDAETRENLLQHAVWMPEASQPVAGG